MVWVLPLRNAKICHSVFLFKTVQNVLFWSCVNLPTSWLLKWEDLEAVLFENYRVKSSNGLNMQGLIHVMIKSKLLIRAFKVGGFTGLVAVLESHCGHFVLCFFVFGFLIDRPTEEFLNHMETSPLPVKGCKFWPMFDTHGHWAVRVL